MMMARPPIVKQIQFENVPILVVIEIVIYVQGSISEMEIVSSIFVVVPLET